MEKGLTTVASSILLSSQDATRLSLTVKGLLVSLVPVFMIVLQTKGIATIGESDLVAFIEAVTNTVAVLFAAAGTVMTTFGMLRKFLNPAGLSELGDEVEK